MAQPHKIVIERDAEGAYVATFSGLLRCRCQAQATSLKALMEQIQKAMAPYLEPCEPAEAAHRPPGATRDGPGPN
jgi:predicted RNase H-like HicB family nuclease